MENKLFKAYVQIHIAVLLYGFTAILGDLISLPAFMIVWWRVFITSLSLLFLIQLGKNLKNLSIQKIKIYAGIGVLIALHWLCFYGSIKLANASVALITMSTAALFTAILEPVFYRKSHNHLDLSIGALIIPGMWLIVSGTDTSMHLGIITGLLSALFISIFAILNKVHIEGTDHYTISFIELGTATVFLSFVLPFILYLGPDMALLPPSMTDWVYLIVLSLLCTTFAYVLSLKALKHISAFAINLVFNMEPIYGIGLAILILQEQKELSSGFYLGSFIILATVILYPIIKHRKQKQ